MKVAFVLATTGAFASAIVHALALCGINVESYFPDIRYLHVGAVGMGILTIVYNRDLFGKVSRWRLWSVATRSAPTWAKVFLFVFFVYWFLAAVFHEIGPFGGGVPYEPDGRQVRELTPEEYSREVLFTVQSFSGVWVLAYGTAGLVLYSRFMERNTNLRIARV